MLAHCGVIAQKGAPTEADAVKLAARDRPRAAVIGRSSSCRLFYNRTVIRPDTDLPSRFEQESLIDHPERIKVELGDSVKAS